MQVYQSVSFTHEGRDYQVQVKHYKWNGKSFMRATWFEYDRWNGKSYPRVLNLWWTSVGDDLFFMDSKQRASSLFIQALGNAAYQTLNLTSKES